MLIKRYSRPVQFAKFPYTVNKTAHFKLVPLSAAFVFHVFRPSCDPKDYIIASKLVVIAHLNFVSRAFPSQFQMEKPWERGCAHLTISRVFLMLIPVRFALSREFVYDFYCFVSCRTSQNVAFRIYLHEVNSKFHVNRHYRWEALFFILSDIT